MRIYLICTVRNASPELLMEFKTYVERLEAEGHEVHYPPRDVDQNDAVGAVICRHHLSAMKLADRVDVFWDVTSLGSHFDLGMAYALGKPVYKVKLMQLDGPGKSYAKLIDTMTGGDYAPDPESRAFCTLGRKSSTNISLSGLKPG